MIGTQIQIYHVQAHGNTVHPPTLFRRDGESFYKILRGQIPPLCSGTDHIVAIAAVARAIERFCPSSAVFRTVQILNPQTEAVEGDAMEVRPHQELNPHDVLVDPRPPGTHLWHWGRGELFVSASLKAELEKCQEWRLVFTPGFSEFAA